MTLREEMTTKSEQRLESKKRKAAAFLNLVKTEQEETNQQTQLESDSRSETTPEKKQKLENSTNSDQARLEKTGPEANASRQTNGKPQTAEEMLEEYKKILREKQKKSMERPKIFLTLDELTRDFPNDLVSEEVKATPPLFITDVQNLLLYSLQGIHASYKPRWCQLLRQTKVSKVVTVVLDSLSKDEFDLHTDYLPTLKSAFDVNVKLVPPAQYGSTVAEELLNVPFSLRLLQNKFPDMKKETFSKIKQTMKQHGGQCPVITGPSGQSGDSAGEGPAAPAPFESKFDRRLLMLSPEQMIREGIPMPYDMDDEKYQGFTYSKQGQYKAVSSTSPLFAVDCEMVQTTESRMDLARISIVNEKLETVYDTYVKPKARIEHYVTKYSGITKQILANVTTTVEDVQKKLDSILPPDAILCGQSIGGDLRSMKVFHPYLIDTSVIYNTTGNRNIKTGLKKLAANFLSKTIQNDEVKGHSSVEDATATMELVQLKLKNDITFGNYVMCSTEYPERSATANSDPSANTQEKDVSHQQELRKRKLFFQHERQKFSETFLERIARDKKTGVIIDEPNSEANYPHGMSVLTYGSDKQRQKQTTQSCEEVDFCLTCLHGYRDFLSSYGDDHTPTEEEKQKCLWKLDRRLWKILKSAPTKCVFVVILTGREQENRVYPSMAFAKIV